MAEPVRVALVTAPDEETGRRLATALVQERLAACANLLGGVTSIYRWQGEVEHASEVLLVLKTRADRADALRERVVALHPYEVPEVVFLEVSEGHVPYLDWVREESRPRGPGV